MKRTLLLLIVVAASLSIYFTSCTDNPTTVNTPANNIQKTCPIMTWQLRAGQTINVGTVTVTNDETNIIVTYNLSPGVTLGNLHMWIGAELSNVPKTKTGNLIPGKFPFTFNAAGQTSYTFTIPFTTLKINNVYQYCNDLLNIVTHAEVTGNFDSDPELETETAFGGNETGDYGNRWWYYGKYFVCCPDKEEELDPEPGACNTAFAFGTHVFNCDYNPDQLYCFTPNIGTRWGWAIKLYSQSSTPVVYNIYRSAAHNSTNTGEWVGTLSILWNNNIADVTYDLRNGYTMTEVHLYADDIIPDFTAPGQYGNTESWPNQTKTTYTFEDIPLTDAGSDGVWFIAHAVVCGVYVAPCNEWITYGSLYTTSNDIIYSIDLQSKTKNIIYNPGNLNSSTDYPNGNAYDEENKRIYLSTPSKLYFYDIDDALWSGEMNIYGTITCGAWFNGAYYYIPVGTDKLYAYSVNGSGSNWSTALVSGYPKDINGTDTRTFSSFGDIVFDPEHPGLLLVSATTNMFVTNSTGFLYCSYDINSGNFTKIKDIEKHRQLAFGSNGVLYGLDAQVGNFYIINKVTGIETPYWSAGLDFRFTDLASGPQCQ